jgi:N-acetylglucosaminyldiphosphoundecaprenol N-acetyl-beta-D-mannosaminyltransferase
MPTLPIKSFPVSCNPPTDVLQHLINRIQTNAPFTPVVTFNITMLPAYQQDPDLAQWIKEHAVITADGMSVVLLGMLRYGKRVPRYPGIDMAHQLLANTNGLRVVLIGGSDAALNGTVAYIQSAFPSHSIVYAQNGYKTLAHNDMLSIKAQAPQLVLIAQGCPKQDHTMQALAEYVPTGVAIGVGGVFDVWSGQVERVSKVWRWMGLEWLGRCLQHPRRVKRVLQGAVAVFLPMR